MDLYTPVKDNYRITEETGNDDTKAIYERV